MQMKKNHNRRFTRLSHKRILIIDLQQKNITIFSTASNITNNTGRVYKNKLVHLSPLNANIVCIRVCIPRNSEVFPLLHKCRDDRYINMYNVKHSLTTSELFFFTEGNNVLPCFSMRCNKHSGFVDISSGSFLKKIHKFKEQLHNLFVSTLIRSCHITVAEEYSTSNSMDA